MWDSHLKKSNLYRQMVWKKSIENTVLTPNVGTVRRLQELELEWIHYQRKNLGWPYLVNNIV